MYLPRFPSAKPMMMGTQLLALPLLGACVRLSPLNDDDVRGIFPSGTGKCTRGEEREKMGKFSHRLRVALPVRRGKGFW